MTTCVLCEEAEGVWTPLAFQDDHVAVWPARWQPTGHRGYTFVVTRSHTTTLYELDDAALGHVMARVRDVARAVELAFGASGTTLMQNNNPPGQEIDHVHFHIAPRFMGDDYWHVARPEVDFDERSLQAAELRSALDRFGIAAPNAPDNK